MPKRKSIRKSRKLKSKRKSRKSKRKSRKSRKRKSRKSKRKSRKRKSRKRKRKSRKSKRKSADSPKKGLRGIRLKKGELAGYKLSDKTIHRRITLGQHVYEKGYLPVMKRVNVLSVLLRNKSPALSKNAESDKKWLMKRQKQGGSESRWIPRKSEGDGFFR